MYIHLCNLVWGVFCTPRPPPGEDRPTLPCAPWVSVFQAKAHPDLATTGVSSAKARLGLTKHIWVQRRRICVLRGHI